MERHYYYGLYLASALLTVTQEEGYCQSGSRWFPMEALDPRARTVFVPNQQAVRDLWSLQRVRFEDVVVAPGMQFDLELSRIPMDQVISGNAWHVDGAPATQPNTFQSLWRGRVMGDTASDVYLSFSTDSCIGWIKHSGGYEHLTFLDSRKSASQVTWISEQAYQAAGFAPNLACEVERLTPATGPIQPAPLPPSFATTTYKRVDVALECDWQLTEQFGGNVLAVANYITALFGAVSERYAQQAYAVLPIVYLGTYSTSNDPWITPDTGTGTTAAMLTEFRTAWSGNLPNGARLAHHLSGSDLGGGRAYLNVLCNSALGFAVSSGIVRYAGTTTPLPVSQGPLNWDYKVTAHETGHNFGATHTHEFCPPVDSCADTIYFGPCQTGRICISNGTIMSYCHTCIGGVNNIDPVFHPANAAQMQASVQNATCLPTYCTAGTTTYCIASPNSTSANGARIDASGSFSLAAGNVLLSTVGVPPDTMCRYYFSTTQTQVAFGNGFRCINSPFLGLPIMRASPFGDAVQSINFQSYPGNTITTPSVRHFQLWYRNPAASGAKFNLSDGISLYFCP